MHEQSSKNLVLGISSVFILIISIFGFSFALFNYMRTSSSYIETTAGSIMAGFVENSSGINLTNALPVSDDVILSSTGADNYLDFYVTYDVKGEASLSYEINIENVTSQLSSVKDGSLTSLPSGSVKVALKNMDNGTIVVSPRYFSFIENISSSNGKSGYYLYSESSLVSGRDNYRLYMWIPEVDSNGVDVNPFSFGENSIKDKTFSVKINVQAIADVEK